MAITFVAAATARSTATGTSLSCNVPAGTADGDFMVAQVQGRISSVVGVVQMAGWTEQQNSDGVVGHQHRVYTRTASSEPASYSATSTSATSLAVTITTWRPTSGYRISVEQSSAENDLTLDTTVTSGGVTTASTDTVVVSCFGVNEGAAPTRIPLTLNASQTKRAETNTTTTATGQGLCQGSEARASAGATGSRNATTAGGNTQSSAILVVLKEALIGTGASVNRRRRIVASLVNQGTV